VVLAVRLSALSIAISAVPLCFAQRAAGVLSVQDVLKTRAIPFSESIQLSPDGNRVALVLQDTTQSDLVQQNQRKPTGVSAYTIGADVWVTDTRTEQTQNITRGNSSNWAPRWSPDGKSLAFFSDREGVAHLFVWDVETTRTRRVADLITTARGLDVDVIQWLPDSKSVLVRTPPAGMAMPLSSVRAGKRGVRQEEAAAKDIKVFTSRAKDPSVVEDLGLYAIDVALVDVSSGRWRRIISGRKPLEYWLSPNGRSIAFTDLIQFAGGDLSIERAEFRANLTVHSLETNAEKIVAPSIRQATNFAVSWSPDSRALAYVTSLEGKMYTVSADGGEPVEAAEMHEPAFVDRAPAWDAESRFLVVHDQHDLWKLDLQTHRASLISRLGDREIVQLICLGWGGSHWGRSGGSGRFWSPDGGRSLIVSTHDERSKKVGFYRIRINDGHSEQIFEEAKYYGLPPYWNVNTSISEDQKTMAYVAQDTGHAEDVWLVSGDLRKSRKVSHSNPELEKFSFGRSEVVTWTANGKELHGGLLLPVGYKEGSHYPTIVSVYGGNLSSGDVNRFGFANIASGIYNMQLFATRGYAVFIPDAPVRPGKTAEDMAADVLPGLDKIIELGIADPQRLGLIGHNFGGYTALTLLTKTQRFQAAVMRSGFGDLASVYGELGDDGSAPGIDWVVGQGGMRGAPWESADRYVENSPIYHLDKITSSLLILHGSEDFPFTAEMVYSGLQHLGRKVEYVRYKGEGGLEWKWTPAHQADFMSRIQMWFDDNLKSQH
jgi:dipeptidyl aminopeptidase/acylaminoacyl peptidase